MHHRTLFLHAGPPKTGTSAIQAQMRNAPPPGLFYPATGQWSDGAHHQLVFALQGLNRRGAVEIPPLDTLAHALEGEIAETTKDVLISSEAFDPESSLPAFLEHFDSLITQKFTQVVPIVVLRHPLERAASMYNQQIKDAVAEETRTPDAYLAAAGQGALIAPFVRRWKAAYPETRFLPYAPATDLIPRFCAALGHPVPSETPPIRRNASMGGRALIALLISKRLLPNPEARTAFFTSLREDKSFGVWRGAGFPFSHAAVGRFTTKQVAEDLSEVERLAGLRLPEAVRKPRFSLTHADRTAILRHVASLPGADAAMGEIEALMAEFTQQM